MKLASVSLLLLLVSVAGLAQKHLPKVEKLIIKQQYLKAEVELKAMYANDSSAPEYSYYMGEINREQGRYDMAEKYLNKALGINPGSAQVTAALGKVYAQERKITKAITQLSTAIIMDSANDEYHCSLGAVYMLMDDYETALTILLKAYTLNPKSATTLFNLGLTYSRLKKYDEAVIFLSKSLKKYKDRRVYKERAYAWYQLGRYRKAIRDYTKAIRRKDTKVAWDKQGIGELYYSRAQVWKGLGNKAKYERDMLSAKGNGYGQ